MIRTTIIAVILLASFLKTSSAMADQTSSSSMRKPQAGYLRVMVGDAEVTALSDGTMVLTPDMLTGAPRAEIDRHLGNAHMQAKPLHTSVNIFLIRHAGRTVLIDGGCGLFYGPTLNKLPASLRAAGYSPEEITDVFITHLHDDHAGGLVAGDERIFPNATVHVDRREGVNAMVEPYEKVGKLARFEGSVELMPGIRSEPTPGHSPGHSGYMLESNGEQLLFWGDLMHIEEVQFPAPQINVIFDGNRMAAMKQRQTVFADAAKRGYLVAGAHVTYPGIGRLAKEGSGYRW
ncbi:MBL fold metallo-hydrolase [Agrobacterium sp. Ap1]|uniref:MBL fold metallo-hydrolase n=1 Tax=Agrobacterium sp. Ap1 TaxID=2815337 RepID=UPI001A908389|nr:MBL fold metallo-hydrolase [Agrobacterium sp. Ap1]MBO0144636.1 MBL fold metallo-hydrolase [Agrobacterium sp. Ap1]